MSKKSKSKGYNYYKEFAAVSNLIVESSNMLKEALQDYDVKSLEKRLAKLHEVERTADNLKYDMMNFLYSDFLPPIEREDIINLACALDTIIDLIEDILKYIDMFQITQITPEMMKFMELIEKSADCLHDAIKELKSFKKPKDLNEAIIMINRLENEGDELYVQSVKKLFADRRDPIDTIALIRIYDYFEESCDSFEDAADIISSIILKNS
jgi:predicted phosphate transport protein (TIGR00153 family)